MNILNYFLHLTITVYSNLGTDLEFVLIIIFDKINFLGDNLIFISYSLDDFLGIILSKGNNETTSNVELSADSSFTRKLFVLNTFDYLPE